MPAVDSVDPTKLDALAERMARSRAAALEASHEVLAHYADTGDVPTQRAVDTLIDHAGEALRRLTDSLADAADVLDAAARRATVAQPAGAVPLSRTGSRRGHSA